MIERESAEPSDETDERDDRELHITRVFDAPRAVVTITFEDRGASKTLMTVRQRAFDTRRNRDGHGVGWNSGFDRLAEFLEKEGN